MSREWVVFLVFSHTGIDCADKSSKKWNGHNSSFVPVLKGFNTDKGSDFSLDQALLRDTFQYQGGKKKNLNVKWVVQRFSFFPVQLCTPKCKMAENAWAYHHHRIIEWLSAQTCCFCRILWVPVKEMTQWYKARAHSWSPVIAHMHIREPWSSFLDRSSFLGMFLVKKPLNYAPLCNNGTFIAKVHTAILAK